MNDFGTRTLKALKGEAAMPLWLYFLAPSSLAYSLAMRARAALYGMGVFGGKRLPCGVISVGNITAGGTGKTPMVAHIAGVLKDRGVRVAVLTRGYGGRLEGKVAVVSDGDELQLSSDDAGDEALLFARALPGVPVVMGADRYKAGMLAVELFGVDVVILDDGFQHMALERDLNILLVDAGYPFGNGFTLPMGYLREPKSALKRADMVILTRADVHGEPSTAKAAISSISPSTPIVRAEHRPTGLYELFTGNKTDMSWLSDRAVLALSGVANPTSFTLILQKLNAKITGSESYPDHHRYTQADMEWVEAQAAHLKADAVVTTEKDAVKLAGLKTPGGTKVLVLAIEVELGEEEDILDGALDRVPGVKR